MQSPIGKEKGKTTHRIESVGLTEEEAQTHCNDPETKEEGVWFDGYRSE